MEPWTNFRNLCQYYIDCVRYSEKQQEYLFADQLNKGILMPRLPLNWHRKREPFDIQTSKDELYVRKRLLESSDENELFIGYPLNSFISPTGTACLCPVILFPVTATVIGPGYTTGLRITIDRQGISLNQSWIEFHIPRDEQKAFRKVCAQSDDGFGAVDVDSVLCYLHVHFPEVNLDPNLMQFSLRHSASQNSLLNTAVLFGCSQPRYTQTLIQELRRISSEPDAVLDQTALAFFFRTPCFPSEIQKETPERIPASFMKRSLNAAQFNAIKHALNHPVTKVTGPPGTGKSFMAVNLIANEVLAGGSVLFSSKNHKAVHAIFDKVTEAIENRDFPLVSFCTTPSAPDATDWQTSQDLLDERIAKAALYHSKDQNSLPIGDNADEVLTNLFSDKLDILLSSFRDLEQHINHYQNLRERMSRYERLLLDIEKQITCIPKTKIESPDFQKLLEKANKLLSESPRVTFLQKLKQLLGNLFGRQSKDSDALKLVAEIAPELATPLFSAQTVSREVKRILKLVKIHSVLKSMLSSEQEILQLEESEIKYEELQKIIAENFRQVTDIIQQAYLEIALARMNNVEETDSLVQKCKSILNRVAPPLEFLAMVGDGGKYNEILSLFRKYLDIFPAWAVTMLSVKRAAPCIPGVFSLAIVDEASQCEIPPLIPVLFRAKRAAIIGDPNQFPPVITLKETIDSALRRKYHLDNLENTKFLYRTNNSFSVTPGMPLMLNEHFRCADDIATYFNDEYYDDALMLSCEYGRENIPMPDKLKPGMEWVEASGGDQQELEAVLEYLTRLKSQKFQGTIGIISPLRELANKAKTLVASHKESVPEQLDFEAQINTANGFQGGECDIILFLLGLNENRKHGEEWYITAQENKYIFNVSVSRAKILFVAFGNRQRAMMTGLSYIQKLIPEERKPRRVSIGPGEEKLQIALQRAEIETVAQFPVAGRYLDLAIPELKIDIEVDGQAYHLDRFGCRKSDDVHRDCLLDAKGWKVIRFWHNEIINNTGLCIQKIMTAIAERRQLLFECVSGVEEIGRHEPTVMKVKE